VPAVDQVQFSPFHYRRRLLDYCLEHGIVFEAYGPLARGRGVQHPTITALAERLDRTPAQVMLRWAIQHQAVVIPKSSRKDRISSNARLFDFELAGPRGPALGSAWRVPSDGYMHKPWLSGRERLLDRVGQLVHAPDAPG